MSQGLFTGRLARVCLLAALACLWMPSRAAEGIRIVTEELAPYNMTKDGQVTGMSTEVVQAVLKLTGIQASIQSMPWARAYDTALNSENVLIYSIMRTPQRESLFKWVGVIAPSHWFLFALPRKDLSLRHLDEARKYQIATVKEDVGEQYLLSKGFAVGQNLQSSNKYEFNYEKLKLGRVDLWISNELAALYLSRQAGDNPEVTLVRVLALPDLESEQGMHMAFSRKTPDELVERFRKGLETIRRNGTYELIAKKWL